MKVLVIAPHPDDETIGCGGALRLHQQRGDRAVVVFLTSGELGLKHLPREKAWAVREKEANASARILGVARVYFLRQPDWMLGDRIKPAARALRPVLLAEKPQLIYVPHEAEWHPDHQAALPVLRFALRGWRGALPELRAYEVWTPLAAHDRAEDITRVMPRKLAALRAHQSQLNEFDYERAVRGLNAFRGELAAKCRYAEVFQSVPPEAGA
jgi:LmbE family N-acetylglucosaminyl deacetylase